MNYQPLSELLHTMHPMLDLGGLATVAEVKIGSLIKFARIEKTSFINTALSQDAVPLTEAEKERVFKFMLGLVGAGAKLLNACVEK
jgi:hypothetical protein